MRLAFAPLALLLMLFGGSCGGDDDTPLSIVFSGAAWNDGERLVYQLRQRDEIRGTCVYETSPVADGLQRLSAGCASPDRRYRDDRWVDVTPTLRPVRSERSIIDLEKAKRTVFSATYAPPEVRLSVEADGEQNETTRALPTPAPGASEAPYYDDTSLFWLLRSATLSDKYEAAFRDVNPGNARVFTVRLAVTGSERIRVPAGEFETWQVEVRTESITQVVWVEKSGARRVVRARIERDLYELIAQER